METSKIYVDKNGFLNCGKPSEKRSIVDGLTMVLLPSIDDQDSEFEVHFINEMNFLCNGYGADSDKRAYSQAPGEIIEN